MKYLIGIDIGTSGTKTVKFDVDGNITKSKTAEYSISQPQNGWAEQDPEIWVKAAFETLEHVGLNNVAGIGLSGQMHGLVMLDENNEVIRPAILWCDQRTSDECNEITEDIGREKLFEITASPAMTGFTLSKIMWIKKHEPDNFERCRHILLPKDYIRFKLTGEFATDFSDASGTQLLNIKNRCWSDELLDKFGINKKILPKLYESCEITGYYKDIPVVAGGGDNACTAVGCGTIKNGRAFTTIGTSGVVYAHTNTPVIDYAGRTHTFCSAVPNEWHIIGVTQAAGLSLKWFRENFVKDLSYADIDEIVKKVPVGAEKLLYLPYLMGERTPYLDSNARGVFFGISSIHKKEHFLRSIMEGVSYSLRDCLEVLKDNNVSVRDMTIIGGGSKSGVWREILSGVFNLPIKTSNCSDGAALGAAILAGVGVGIYESIDAACESIVKYSSLSKEDNPEEYDKFYALYRKLYFSLKNDFRELMRL
mgnify:CR=1 FL=1